MCLKRQCLNKLQAVRGFTDFHKISIIFFIGLFFMVSDLADGLTSSGLSNILVLHYDFFNTRSFQSTLPSLRPISSYTF